MSIYSKIYVITSYKQYAYLLFRQILERFSSSMETNLTGMNAIRHLWSCFIDIFGHSDDLIIVFRIHNYLKPGLPFISEGQDMAPNIKAILAVIKTLINQCKDEGIFTPDLDSDMATRLLLSLFSNIIENIANMSEAIRKSPGFYDEITKGHL